MKNRPGMGWRVYVFLLLFLNLAWWYSGWGWTPYRAATVNVGMAVAVLLWLALLAARYGLPLAARLVRRLGFDRLAGHLFRAAGLLSPFAGRFACRLEEMEMAVRREDFALADALWSRVEPHLARPEVCATLACAHRASGLLVRGRLQEAVAATEPREEARAVHSSPGFPEADARRLGARAEALRSLGHWAEARRCLEEGLPRAATRRPVLLALRQSQAWLEFQEGNPAGALRRAREAMALVPTGCVEAGWALLVARCGADLEAEELLARRSPVGRTARTLYLREMAAGWVAVGRDRRAEALAHFDVAAALPVPPGEEMRAAADRAREWGEEEAAGRYRAAVRSRNPESVWALGLDPEGPAGPAASPASGSAEAAGSTGVGAQEPEAGDAPGVAKPVD